MQSQAALVLKKFEEVYQAWGRFLLSILFYKHVKSGSASSFNSFEVFRNVIMQSLFH